MAIIRDMYLLGLGLFIFELIEDYSYSNQHICMTRRTKTIQIGIFN